MATDHDIPGQIAAERAYWQLTLHGLDPRHATWAPGSDPADTLHTGGAAAIQTALHNAQPLADTLIDERLRNLPTEQAASRGHRRPRRPTRPHLDQPSGHHRRPHRRRS